jgi:prophage regulatory protein
MTELPNLGERLLRLRDVEQKTGLSSTTIYRKMTEGSFPRPLQLGPGSVRWRETKVEAWIDGLAETVSSEIGQSG